MVRQPIAERSSLRRLKNAMVELVDALDDYLTDKVQELNNSPLGDAPPPQPAPADPQDSIRLTYSINEAAAALGVGRTTLWKLIRDGRLQRVNVLGRALIRREDIDRLLRA